MAAFGCPPRYKLDSIVIDQRIDEVGRPLPERVCLGSLNKVAQELGLAADHGTTNQHLKRALRQNALAGITAKFRYKTNDGSERTLEATFCRRNLVAEARALGTERPVQRGAILKSAAAHAKARRPSDISASDWACLNPEDRHFLLALRKIQKLCSDCRARTDGSRRSPAPEPTEGAWQSGNRGFSQDSTRETGSTS